MQKKIAAPLLQNKVGLNDLLWWVFPGFFLKFGLREQQKILWGRIFLAKRSK